MVLTQFGTKIKSIKSNNALEFNIPGFYNSNGIVHQLSYVYTPQQNSVMERKHQYILATARALQIQSNVLLSFWGDCVLTAVYLINRLPSPLLDNKTPFVLLFKRIPSYFHLKTFDCLCYATNLNPHKHKFTPRARKSIFLGYPFNVKGYKLFDLQSHFVFISRDVVFYENIFLFSTGTSLESTSLIPLPVIPTVPSSSFTDFPLSTTTSSSSSLSDDTVIQIHHDFDEDIQEFPNAIDPSIPSTALDAPNQSSSTPGQPSIVPKRSTRPSRPPLLPFQFNPTQPQVHFISFVLISLMITFPLHTRLFFVPFPQSQNPHAITKQLATPNGKKPWMLKSKHWKLTILGHFHST